MRALRDARSAGSSGLVGGGAGRLGRMEARGLSGVGASGPSEMGAATRIRPALRSRANARRLEGRLEGRLLPPLLVALLAVFTPFPAHAADDTVVVASKNFEESRLLAEMFSQLLEARTDLTVERRFNLAGTQVCFEALRSGAVDLYPEYTGTGLLSILGAEPAGDPTATLVAVRSRFLARWDLHWLAPLGFENAYAIAVPRRLAAARHLTTLSDLAAVSGDLRAAFGYEFIERPDGLPGLRDAYGMAFAASARCSRP